MEELKAYSVKLRKMVTIQNPEIVTLKNGRKAVRGVAAEDPSSKVIRIVNAEASGKDSSDRLADQGNSRLLDNGRNAASLGPWSLKTPRPRLRNGLRGVERGILRFARARHSGQCSARVPVRLRVVHLIHLVAPVEQRPKVFRRLQTHDAPTGLDALACRVHQPRVEGHSFAPRLVNEALLFLVGNYKFHSGHVVTSPMPSAADPAPLGLPCRARWPHGCWRGHAPLVSPWLTQPGMAEHSTIQMPSSSRSIVTESFISSSLRLDARPGWQSGV